MLSSESRTAQQMIEFHCFSSSRQQSWTSVSNGRGLRL